MRDGVNGLVGSGEREGLDVSFSSGLFSDVDRFVGVKRRVYIDRLYNIRTRLVKALRKKLL